MTDTHAVRPGGAPVPGWYADPAGSGGLRWWDGTAWTASLLAPEHAPPPAPAPSFHPAFGGGTFAGPRVPVASLPATTAPTRSRGALLAASSGLVALLLIVYGIKVFGSGGTDQAATPLPGSNGARGPAQVASMRSDARTVANAEETTFTDQQKYVPVVGATSRAMVGTQPVVLSAGNVISVNVNAPGTAFCVSVTSTNRLAGTQSAVIYVSSMGGLQDGSATSCPAAF